ncbi:uncharacterized protein BX664DRAFT_336183 [Halteromyces radiatus]|uniref:uncharacterized protein n=1 Tax=Halteromyces radiatus TaxID=101107 RepID=UPI00221F9F33|nr:uncharacterized protein BX664DRAFT_336183 [Halteromyces radiatus]KAI8086576.1 hypothetical protein BX664DRAFT_336183 [Halteromyces radiatus]
MVAKQMAKALTTTCHKQSIKTSSSNMLSSSSSIITPPASTTSSSTTTTDNSTNKITTPNTSSSVTTESPSKPLNPASTFTTPPASPPASSSSTSINDSVTDNKPTSVEPMTEIKDGVEWVSFVYSHHRVVRRYRIRTDLDTVQVSDLDEKFKSDNCVYPRANLPRESYQGNRWAYETECNTLGWKLAHLNMDEIAGKRGLIQRAVDSYRNRYPSMRSRRVARQEKLLKGTLRKRKQSPTSEDDVDGLPCKVSNIHSSSNNNDSTTTSSSSTTTTTSSTSKATPCSKIPKIYPCHEKTKAHPKTLTIEDHGVKCRVRINIESVDLNLIDDNFRRNNCVFPRAMNLTSSNNLTQRRQDEAKCNEIGWKLAWLNPKHLANKKNLLQRILDIYRTKFVPHLTPRQSPRTPKQSTPTENKPTPLTTEALAAHHQQQEQLAAKNGLSNNSVRYVCKKKEDDDDNDTIYTGTTDSLDFRDCFSPPPETTTTMDDLSTFDDPLLVPILATDLTDFNTLTVPPPPPMMGDEYFESVLDPLASPPPQSLSATLTSSSDLMDDTSCHLSVGSCQNSPPHRYTSLGPLCEDTFMDPFVLTTEDHSSHSSADVYMFDTKSTTFSPLPTDIFAAQDMDWTPDVEDCMLADLHSDVLVHQLFLA